MRSISIQEDILKKILEEAYEAGWSGCIELKSHFVKNIIDELFFSHNKLKDVSYCDPSMLMNINGGEYVSINTNDLTISQLNNNQVGNIQINWTDTNGHNLLFDPNP